MTPTGAPLTLFNSLSRGTEPFVPIDPDMVRLYSCGPTVYSTAHLGNLRAYVFTDTLRRVLNWKGYATTHVVNITDVGHLTSDADAGDDKMELAAAQAGESAWDVAARYTALFKADLSALNVLDPSVWSVATQHIQDMIAFAAEIEAHGSAYRLEGGLYFDTATVPDYGRLARAGAAADEGHGRIEPIAGKRHPADFAIWRRSGAHERRQMEWSSPWGPGAPGWHLECSVMSMKYLGRQFDIHTGGIDHREIHHVNEIAQNQAFTCTAETGATLWMHNNFLVDRTGKMSKSKGGVATLAALVARGVHPLAYRLLCLGAHYRSELDFSLSAVAAALTRLKRLAIALTALREQAGAVDLRPYREVRDARGAPFTWQRHALEGELSSAAGALVARFDTALAADLNTPQALVVLDEALAADLGPAERLRLVASFDLALGLDLPILERRPLSVRPEDAALDDAEVDTLLDARARARAARDFAAADAARDRLKAAGVEIMDGDPLRWEWRPLLAD